VADKSEPTINELRSIPPVSLTPRPTTDAIGRKLDWSNADKAMAQQREAVGIRDDRVKEDTLRVERGLAPRWATE
jgi:hypothetical protein